MDQRIGVHQLYRRRHLQRAASRHREELRSRQHEERPEALADGILSLLRSSASERERRHAAARAAAEPYSIELLTDEIEALYDRAIAAAAS